jgi:hypothetical protein
MNQESRIIAIGIGILAIIGGGWFYWWRQQTPPPPAAVVAPPPPPPPAPAPPPDVAAAPAIQHPLEPAPPEDRTVPAAADADEHIRKSLLALLGKKAMLTFISNVPDVVRAFVITVDNLGNERAQSQLWPVKATPGVFQMDGAADSGTISAANAARYAPFVQFVTSVDTRRIVGLYRRLYPLFQQAYEEIGYPGKYFNDRVVEVIDQLLATPKVSEPIRIKRVQVEGSRRPLYQFDDPALESRSAGQKILLRIGSDNATRLKAKLSEIRRAISKGPGGRPSE